MPKQEMPTDERLNAEQEQTQEENKESEETIEKLFAKENIFSEQFIEEQKIERQRPVVAFDVDETILYIKGDGSLKEDWILRPGAEEAFSEISAKADIILWTSTGKEKMQTMLKYFPFLKEQVNLIITVENYIFLDNQGRLPSLADYTNNPRYKFLYEQVKSKYKEILNLKSIDDYPKPKEIKRFIKGQPSVLKEAERLLKNIKRGENQKEYSEIILTIFQEYLDEIVQLKNGGIIWGENTIVVDNVYGHRRIDSLNLFPFHPIDGRSFIVQDMTGLSEEDIKLYYESLYDDKGGMEQIKNEVLQILQKQKN